MPHKVAAAAGVAAAALTLSACGPVAATSGVHMGSGMGGPGSMYSRLTCTAPAQLPRSTVLVTLSDMGMSRMMSGTAPRSARMLLRAVPARVAAGDGVKVTLVARNMGWRTHELVVLPLSADASAGQRIPGADGRVDEAGSLGEASKSCGSGAGDGIAAGATGWVTLTLDPGRYELICNLPNHYADGMYQELIVTG